MVKLKIIILVGLILLAGCAGQPPPASTLEATGVLPPTATATFTASPPPTTTATSTQLPPTLTWTATSSPTPQLPTATPTIPPEVRLKNQCLEAVPELPGNADVRDIIVLEKLGSLGTWLWNMETGSRLSLHAEGVGGYDYRVSPNGQWIAYIKNTVPPSGAWIAIATTDGQERAVISWEKEWRGISHWLDNQRLILSGLQVPGDAYSPVIPLLILNPFTGERQELPPLPPHIALMLHPSEGRMISYDPTLTYIVYPIENFETVFENLQTHEILAQFGTVWETVPRWSPDGQRFVILTYFWSDGVPVESGLYSIDLQGQMQRLTQLSDYDIERTSYYWSPDGRYIALWLITDPEHDNRVTLGVLDTVTLDVVNYCIVGEHITKFPPPLFWSPDSRQLVMEIDDANDATPKRVVVVDIVSGWAAQIAEGMQPAGWMVSP